MKTLPLIAALTGLFLASASTSLVAATFTDSFNRDNTTSPAGGLGADWTVTGSLFLNSNVAKTQTAAVSYAVHDGLDLSTSFVASVDLYSQSNGRYGGLVFNYTDANNYYVFRASFHSTDATAWQFLKVVDGVQSTVSSGAITAGSMPLTTWRTLTISSTATTGTYSYQLTSLGGASTIVSGTVSDSSLVLAGQAGFYFSSSNIWADNFSLTTPSSIPEPSVTAVIAGIACVGLVSFRRKLTTRNS